MVCQPVAVDELYAIAREVQKAAELYDAELVVVGGNDKQIAYALPALTDIETLYVIPSAFDRRTWRFIEESTTKRNNVLFINYDAGGTTVGGDMTILVDADGQPMEDENGNPILANPAGGITGGGRGGLGGGITLGGRGRGRGWGGVAVAPLIRA